MTWIKSAASLLALLAACGPIADRRAARIEAAFPPEGQMIHVAGATVHATVRGHGPDLVLIHGASGNTRDMASLAAKLEDRYRVISFDRPGQGYSSDLGMAGTSPLVQADYLRAAAQQLGVRDPVVLGHSYGGAVAMAWALLDPNIKGVVLVSGAVLPWEGGLDRIYQIASTPVGEATVEPLASAFMPDWFLDRTIRTLFLPQTPPLDYAQNIGAKLAIRPLPLQTNIRQLNRLKPHLALMAPHYRELHMPIEIVHGTADNTVSLPVQSIPMTRLPNVHLTQLSGIGHMVHHVAQEEVVAAIDRAFTRD